MVRFVRTEERICILGSKHVHCGIDWVRFKYRVTPNDDGSEWEVRCFGYSWTPDDVENVVPAAEVRAYVEETLKFDLSKIDWMRMGLRKEYLND